jgi:hypothetical protein
MTRLETLMKSNGAVNRGPDEWTMKHTRTDWKLALSLDFRWAILEEYFITRSW